MVPEDRFRVKSMDHPQHAWDDPGICFAIFVDVPCVYIYIYLYLLDGANASNSIKTNFHFTAKPVLCTFWASILGLSEMANGDVPVQVAADGEKTVNSCQLTTPN